jgi:hypothetical protein
MITEQEAGEKYIAFTAIPTPDGPGRSYPLFCISNDAAKVQLLRVPCVLVWIVA